MIFACFTIVAPMIVILIVSSDSDEVVATLVLLLFSWKGFDATLEVTADSLETLPETDRYWLVEGQICRWRWVVYFTWRWMTIASKDYIPLLTSPSNRFGEIWTLGTCSIVIYFHTCFRFLVPPIEAKHSRHPNSRAQYLRLLCVFTATFLAGYTFLSSFCSKNNLAKSTSSFVTSTPVWWSSYIRTCLLLFLLSFCCRHVGANMFKFDDWRLNSCVLVASTPILLHSIWKLFWPSLSPKFATEILMNSRMLPPSYKLIYNIL